MSLKNGLKIFFDFETILAKDIKSKKSKALASWLVNKYMIQTTSKVGLIAHKSKYVLSKLVC